MQVQERYTPQLLGVNATYAIRGASLGGFLAKTSGTLTIVTSSGATLVDAVPVTGGIYLPLPFALPSSEGAVVTLGGGASGTLAV